MKLELTKELRKDGTTWFCIYLDGSYVTSYITLEAAQAKFNALKNAGPETKEILETYEDTKEEIQKEEKEDFTAQQRERGFDFMQDED